MGSASGWLFHIYNVRQMHTGGVELVQQHESSLKSMTRLWSHPRACHHAWCSRRTVCPHPRGRPWGSRMPARHPLGHLKSWHNPSRRPPHGDVSPRSQHASSTPDNVPMPLGMPQDTSATGPTTLGWLKPPGRRPAASSLFAMRHHGRRVLPVPARTETCPVARACQLGPQTLARPSQAARKCGPSSL